VLATDRRSRLAEPQRPHIASTVHDAHDDDFGVGEAVVQRVVAMEVDAQASAASRSRRGPISGWSWTVSKRVSISRTSFDAAVRLSAAMKLQISIRSCSALSVSRSWRRGAASAPLPVE
jgi:hypothetical protein